MGSFASRLHWFSPRHLVAPLMLWLLLTTEAMAACTCGGGGTVPCGVVCCSSSTYCRAGTICADGGCLDRSSARVCSNGNFCNAGDVCTPDGRCISRSSDRYCGDRNFCSPGSACIGGGKCLSTSSERYCGGGRYCAEGSYCQGGGCRSHAADAAERRLALEREALQRAEDLRQAELQQQRDNEARQRQEEQARLAAQRERNQATGNRGSCSTITGPGMPSGAPCPDQRPTTTMAPSTPPPPRASAPPPSAQPRPRIVIFQPPTCSLCDTLKSLGEVLPELAEKLDNLKLETVKEDPAPLYDGGPNTLRPYLSRRPLADVSKAPSTLDNINDLKDIASGIKTLTELTEEEKPPEDYAANCQDGFLDASWKAFTSKQGSYAEKAKTARDTLKKCWHSAVKHITDNVKTAFDPPDVIEEN